MSYKLSSTAASYVVQTKARKDSDVFTNPCVRGQELLFSTIRDGKI